MEIDCYWAQQGSAAGRANAERGLQDVPTCVFLTACLSF